jgi:hypothetical protein
LGGVFEMRVFKFCLLAFILIQGCTENKKETQDSDVHPEISFDDQIELKIEDKYFTVLVDSFLSYELPDYRIDINSDQLVRYWFRSYNNMFEIRFYNQERFEKDDIGANYLFGIKSFGFTNDRAFYIRWRNERYNGNQSRRPKNKWVTSDICKFTIELETNLPIEVIKHYYPNIRCPIRIKEISRVMINQVNLSKIIHQNYQPVTDQIIKIN